MQTISTESQRIIEKILNSELRDESSISESHQPTSQQPSVQMVIQLDSQQSATIKIHPEDDPFILAKAFCFQYSIDPRVINTLANNIRNVKNMEFHNYQNHNSSFNSHSLANQYSSANAHSRSKMSSSMIDHANKENNSTLMNQSINESFNKGNLSVKNNNRTLDRSLMGKNANDTTMLSNGLSRQSVFDRLYQDSRKKKAIKNCVDDSQRKDKDTQRKDKDKKISQSILQDSNMSVDPCLIIYEKNTKLHQSAIMKRQELHKLNEQKITQNCTFKPEINPISDIIAKKLPQSYRSQRNRERDIRRIQKFLQQKQQKELQECTFEPKILNKSRSRSKSAERYKVLYQDSKVRQMKRKTSLESLEKSRKKSGVKINKISQCIVGDKTFFQRLKQDQQKRHEKKVQIQYQIKQQQNRQPSTGRGPTNRPRNISIGQHLYSQARMKSIQKQKQREMPSSTKNRLTCKKSDEIYENTKKTAFEYIFALLDSNEDGLISNTKIQLSRLSGEVLKLLAPLLVEMEEMGAELDEAEFVQALERLFNSFSVADKQTILQVFKYKSRNQQQLPTFQPSLNEKSLMWARQNRPQKMDLYELWKETENEKQERLEEIRAYKVLSELQECTFHPLLFR